MLCMHLHYHQEMRIYSRLCCLLASAWLTWCIEKSNLKHKETVSRKKCGVMKDEISLFSGNSGFVGTMDWVRV